MIFPPNELSESGKDGRFYNWLNKLRLFVVRTRIIPSDDFLFEQNENGTFLKLKGKGGSGTAGVVFKGEWTTDAAGKEKLQEMYIVRAGISKGTYIVVSATGTDAPSSGSPKWVQIAPGANIGSWL